LVGRYQIIYRKTANIIVKKQQFTTPFKDDIRQLADLKQQISQKVILRRSTVTFRRCSGQVKSSFVIFAVLDLPVGG